MRMMRAVSNRVREQREARGLTQAALAEQAAITRQSIHAIESGRATPAVDIALRIARALDSRVEDLFLPAAETQHLDATPATAAPSGRVALAYIDERWVSYPLGGDEAQLSADGVTEPKGKGKVQVELLRTSSELRQTVVLMGCAAGLGVLAGRLNSRLGNGRFLWLPTASEAALGALASGKTHIAGTHLVDPKTGESNVPDVQRIASGEPLVLIALGRWESGLLTRKEDAGRLRGVASLGERGVRLIVREHGAGAQRLLERELRAVGLAPTIKAAQLRASGHLDVARAIAMGAADAGVASRDAALAFGLRFVPLVEERYDLVLRGSLVSDARITRLLDVLVSAAFRRDLTLLGYDMNPAGSRVAEVRAA